MAERRTPVLTGQYDGEVQQEARTRDGFWKQQMRDTFEPNPERVFVFGDVSPSTASTLRRTYGLDAYTVTKNGSTELHVRWLPDRAEAIKAEVAQRGEKRKATIAAKAAKAGKGQAKA